jgi:hypothetical protein
VTSPQSAKFPLKLSVNTHPKKDSKRISSGRSLDFSRTPSAHTPRQSEQPFSRLFDREAILSHYQEMPLYAVLQEFNKVILTSDWQVCSQDSIITITEIVRYGIPKKKICKHGACRKNIIGVACHY